MLVHSKYRLTSALRAGIVVRVMESRRPRVLLVDDDPMVRLVVDRQLDVLGWEAVPVGTGREAIRVVEGGTIVDVLLTDLDLPDINGVAVARAVSGLSPATRVAFMSGAGPSEPLHPHGAPFLLKPFSRTALTNALKGAMPVNAGEPQPRGV